MTQKSTKRIAIIGASTGQYPLCKKAKEMGLETHCFAWGQDAICKNIVDYFHDISIFEMDRIVECCQEIGIDGVATNASEQTALVASYVAEKLKLPGTPYSTIKDIQNKEYVRGATNQLHTISPIRAEKGTFEYLLSTMPIPFIIKPIHGAGKKGIKYIDQSIRIEDQEEIFYAEEFVDGREFSIETLSSKSKHFIIQVTEKISSGAPYFVELGHHQPAVLSQEEKTQIALAIPQILSTIGYSNGPAHIEIKIDNQGALRLIEVNPRGGGDFISGILVNLSTNCDYLKGILDIALGQFEPDEVRQTACAGVYFLMSQTRKLMPYFEADFDWVYERELYGVPLKEGHGNRDHCGHIIYHSNKRITLPL